MLYPLSPFQGSVSGTPYNQGLAPLAMRYRPFGTAIESPSASPYRRRQGSSARLASHSVLGSGTASTSALTTRLLAKVMLNP